MKGFVQCILSLVFGFAAIVCVGMAFEHGLPTLDALADAMGFAPRSDGRNAFEIGSKLLLSYSSVVFVVAGLVAPFAYWPEQKKRTEDA